jgi:hypothetical protein
LRHKVKTAQEVCRSPSNQAQLRTHAPDSQQFSPEQLLTSIELAQRWRVSTKTLANQRWLGEGPPFVRLGRVVRYRMSDVLAMEGAARVAPAEASSSLHPVVHRSGGRRGRQP